VLYFHLFPALNFQPIFGGDVPRRHIKLRVQSLTMVEANLFGTGFVRRPEISAMVQAARSRATITIAGNKIWTVRETSD
jgi:hypothetical protein